MAPDERVTGSARRVARLGLLASGIAGRSLDVAPAGPGESAWTDGRVLFVDPGARPADQVVAVAVQASLVAAGSLEPAIARRLLGRPALARRYLAVEGHRALAASEGSLPWRVRPLIDRATAARAVTAAGSLALAAGRAPVGTPPPGFGVIRPGRLVTSAARGAGAGTEAAGLRRVRPERSRPGGTAGEAGPELPFFANSVGGRGGLAWLLRRMLRLGRSSAAGGPAGAGTSVRASLAPAPGGGVRRTAAAPGTPASSGAARPQGLAYPEWDLHRERYRPDWCTVRETFTRRPGGAPAVIPEERPVRRSLARLGTVQDRRRRQPDGYDIDIDAAIEARADARAGAPGDYPVYLDAPPRRRDLAVLVLLDISGSAGEPGASGQPVHEQQRDAAAMLTAALAGLGDRAALYAFCSQGRTAVRLTRVKGFDDRLDAAARRRLGDLVPGAYTRLGAAIRHGSALLEEHGGTSRRLLVVLSDGLAYDHGYERSYGEADSSRALAEARRRGIGCVCLTVGAGTDPDALRRVFGAAAHASIAGPVQLAPVIGPLFRAALVSAAQRRRDQRTGPAAVRASR